MAGTHRSPEESELLAELASLLHRIDPVPQQVLTSALRAGAFLAAATNADLLELLWDSAVSGEPASVRGHSDVRALSFRAGEATVEVEISATNPDTLAIVGLLTGYRAVTGIAVQSPIGCHESTVDSCGGFQIGPVPRGPLRIWLRTEHDGEALSEWFTS
ncbi:MAG: hypothetical protein ACRDRN_00340 [Sciscionella sp.]